MAMDMRSTKCMIRELRSVWEAVGGQDPIRVWLQGDVVELFHAGGSDGATDPSKRSRGCLDDSTGTILVNFSDIYQTFDKYNAARYRIPRGAFVRIVGELVQEGEELVVVVTSVQDLSKIPDSFSLWLTEVLDVRGTRIFDQPASFFVHD